MAKVEAEKELKTFSIRETNSSISTKIKKSLFHYKHLENILNILLKNFLDSNSGKNLTEEQEEENKNLFWLLLNPVIMKAVLSNNNGGDKTKDKKLKA